MSDLLTRPKMLRNPHCFAALLCLWHLGGCASHPTTVEYTAPPAACCNNIAEFQFRPIEAGSEVELSLTPKESSYTFVERRQHFIALKLPDNFVATTIQVRSFLSTSFLPLATAIVPDFIYLDVDRNVVGKASTSGIQAGGGFWRSSVIGRAQVPGRTRYVIVIAGSGSSAAAVYSENRTPYHIPSAALGDFTLRLFGESSGK